MKPETKSFYEVAVQRAVTHIVTHLDQALDLGVVARAAALSPFHFHRVFRGMLGETPLELHRRLRMERAASRLLAGDAPVTRIALDSGYDTHESFTRAFRAAYGSAPSEFRQKGHTVDAAASDCAQPPSIQLAARCGVHFRADSVADFVFFSPGGHIMDVEIKQMPEFRLGTVHHAGPYQQISEAFQRLGSIAGPAGLLQHPGATMIGVYHDDPETTPPDQLRSEAGLSVPDGVPLPAGLVEVRLPAGRYACVTHVGPYTGLPDVWARLIGQWLPQSGYQANNNLNFEIYRNNPMTAPPHELRTEIYLPLA